MEIMGSIGIWYYFILQSAIFTDIIVPLVVLWLLKPTIIELLWPPNDVGSKMDDMFEFFQKKYEARIAELKLEKTKLQDDLYNSLTHQRNTQRENDELKVTMDMMQKENTLMQEKVKLLNERFVQEKSRSIGLHKMVQTEKQLCEEVNAVRDKVFCVTVQLETDRHLMDSKIVEIQKIADAKQTALEQKIRNLEKELNDKKEAWRTEIASLQAKAHKRLIKASALERELMDKKTEVFFLHHRLMDFMDLVAELRGTRFVPLPLYSHNQKPTHQRVRDDWRDLLTHPLQQIPEETGDFVSQLDPRMAFVNQASFNHFRPEGYA